MKTVLRTLVRFTLAALGAVMLAFASCTGIGVLMLGGSDREVLCNESSSGVAYARSLPQERLAQLYADMETYSTRDGPLDGWWVGSQTEKVPAEFADLKVARIRPREGNIMVQGCFDHYIYLHFSGLGVFAAPNEEPRITLSWGEHPEDMGKQILWERKVQP